MSVGWTARWVSGYRSGSCNGGRVLRGPIGLVVGAALLLVACETDGPVDPVPPLPPTGSISITAPDSLVAVHGAIALSATVLDATGNSVQDPVTWSSSDENVAVATTGGILTGIAQGSVTVSARTATVSATADFMVRGHLVGLGGGTSSAPDGAAWVDVPAGALSQSVVITVDEADESAFPSEPNFVPGTGHDFGPSGQGFLGTIRLNVTYDPSLIPAGVPESSLEVNLLDGGV